jgi:pyruvate formate lyase activating enzyme
MYEALHYENKGDRVVCQLCPHNCRLTESQVGICQVRKNIEGKLYALNYGMCSSIALDPIEKKPLKRFFPGSYVLSLGAFGCNFRCSYCQNWNISQEVPQTRQLSPQQLGDLAQNYHKEDPKCIGVAYTYSEPLVWYEFVLDSAKQVRKQGLKNILVTNGYIKPDPLSELLKYIDAVNLDIKGFTEAYYAKFCGGKLENVLDNVKLIDSMCHLEVTTLLVPGENDSEQEVEALAKFLSGVNPEIPLHLTRYFPNYKLDLHPTPLETMEEAYQVAKKYLHYVYLGNV